MRCFVRMLISEPATDYPVLLVYSVVFSGLCMCCVGALTWLLAVVLRDLLGYILLSSRAGGRRNQCQTTGLTPARAEETGNTISSETE